MSPLRFAPALLLAACTATAPDPTYTPPEASGLVAVRPFPGPDDVCQIIGENALTNRYLDDSATLIGCPVAEPGAIADRKAAGAIELDRIGDWLLLSVPVI
jgi:hypothetical protein